jgi:hypothetical protein
MVGNCQPFDNCPAFKKPQSDDVAVFSREATAAHSPGYERDLS